MQNKAVRAGVMVHLGFQHSEGRSRSYPPVSSVAISVDYVGDPVQNKNKTSKPATLSFSVGVAADKLSKHHRWQHGT